MLWVERARIRALQRSARTAARFRGGGGLDLAQEAELRARDLAQVREQLTRELAEDERLGLHSARTEGPCKSCCGRVKAGARRSAPTARRRRRKGAARYDTRLEQLLAWCVWGVACVRDGLGGEFLEIHECHQRHFPAVWRCGLVT